MSAPAAIPVAAAALASLTGCWLLRRGTRRERGASRWPVAAGWLAIVAGSAPLMLIGGADWAIAILMLTVSLAAFGALAATLRRRGPARRPASRTAAAAEPSLRPAKPWRGVVRAVQAGPLSLAFALAFCGLLGGKAPMDGADRLVLAGLLTPVVWAAAAAWTLTDPKLTRTALGLGLAAAVMAAGAVLA